jgi:hypothetical protein
MTASLFYSMEAAMDPPPPPPSAPSIAIPELPQMPDDLLKMIMNSMPKARMARDPPPIPLPDLSGPIGLMHLPKKIWMRIVDMSHPLARQALALTCKTTNASFRACTSDIRNVIPKAWKDFRSFDPLEHYYYPLMYRVLREAEPWLFTWSVGSTKKIYTNGDMHLSLCFSPPPHEKESPYCAYASVRLKSGRLPWIFRVSSWSLPQVARTTLLTAVDSMQ